MTEPKGKRLLRAWYSDSYHAVQFRAGGALWAQKRRGQAYGLLLTQEQVATAIKTLFEMEGASNGWK